MQIYERIKKEKKLFIKGHHKVVKDKLLNAQSNICELIAEYNNVKTNRPSYDKESTVQREMHYQKLIWLIDNIKQYYNKACGEIDAYHNLMLAHRISAIRPFKSSCDLMLSINQLINSINVDELKYFCLQNERDINYKLVDYRYYMKLRAIDKKV